MNTRSETRSSWVWAALIFQGVILLSSAWGCLQILTAWPRYAAYHSQIVPVVSRELIQTLAVGVSLFGLWRGKFWGWLLAVLVDGAMCFQTLSFFLQYGARVGLNPRLIGFSVWDFIALGVLLHHTVRTLFLGPGRGRPLQPQPHAPAARISGVGKVLRVVVYFAVAVIATCTVTAFSLSLMFGEKLGGPRGFIFILYMGFLIGSFASFLLALALTLAARRFGPTKWWVWLLLGASVAPALEIAMLLLVRQFQGSNVAGVGYLLGGPAYLNSAPWLVIPGGLVTALICYEMYPWTFPRSS